MKEYEIEAFKSILNHFKDYMNQLDNIWLYNNSTHVVWPKGLLSLSSIEQENKK
jgi:hypothetical protein